MSHLPPLIIDLALILGAAGITTLIFRRLRQPLVLGYILSGLLVGPNVSLLPTVSDTEGIKVWADIGVVFLLFALGLEFSFKKLAKVGASAGITGTVEITMMMLIGYSAGQIMGWPQMDSIFLGGIIAISSTTIIFRAFEELGLKTRQFTGLVMGVLIVEDLVAIILMVLLSTAAISKSFEGTEMLLSIGKLLFFLTLWFLLGIFLLPSMLKKASKWMSDETLLVAALALCLGMVILADGVGFSSALGAFVMGSILSETIYGEKIEHLIGSVKHLFGAVFFVSVGMLINPKLLWDYAGPVLLLTSIVIFGKLLFVSIGAILAGKPLRQALEAGSAMTQIGEFSFIIATLGLSLKVTSDYLYPIAVGVSVITTFTTPYMMQIAGPLYDWLQKRLPPRMMQALDKYSAGSQILHSESHWNVVFKSYGQLVLINTVISIAFILLSRYYLKPTLTTWIENNMVATILAVVISLSAMTPFIWALTAKKIRGISYKALWLDSKYNRGPLVMLEALRNAVAVILVGIMIGQYFPLWISLIGTALVLLIILLIFRQRLQRFYDRIEERFLVNLNQKESDMHAQANKHAALSPWDAHISMIEVGPNAQIIGKSLAELRIRENLGVNIAFIERGEKMIYAPKYREIIFPYDQLGAIGTDEALEAFTQMAADSTTTESGANVSPEEIVLEKLMVDERTQLKGLSIKESNIREKTDGLVVGIERNGERILNPTSTTIFEWDDVVWLVGNRKKIHDTYLH